MEECEDLREYTNAVKELMQQPVMSSSGASYHVKNGIIHCGYNSIPIRGFSTSQHLWEIMH